VEQQEDADEVRAARHDRQGLRVPRRLTLVYLASIRAVVAGGEVHVVASLGERGDAVAADRTGVRAAVVRDVVAVVALLAAVVGIGVAAIRTQVDHAIAAQSRPGGLGGA